MGYAVRGLLQIATILESVPLPGRKVIDFGSQDLTIFSDQDFENLRDFVKRLGGQPERLENMRGSAYPAIVPARAAFEAAGFDYTCCDVDRRPGTIYVDLSKLNFDRGLYGKFDIVLNAGTTEHLANPVAAFFLMHQFCARNGLLYNEVPMCGWFNHGLNNLTPKYWHTLRWMNEYRVLFAKMKSVDQSSAAEGNFGGSHLDFIECLGDNNYASASIQVVFQKTSSRGFVPPFDAVISVDDGGAAVASLLTGSLWPFFRCGALTRKDMQETINDFLRFQGNRIRVRKFRRNGDVVLEGIFARATRRLFRRP